MDSNTTMDDGENGAGSDGGNETVYENPWVIIGIIAIGVIFFFMCLAWLYKCCVKDKEDLEQIQLQQRESEKKEETNERNIHKRQGSTEALEHYRNVTSKNMKFDVKDLENGGSNKMPKIGRPTTEEQSDDDELEEKTKED